jgi:ATP-dependent DNA ligase
MPSRTQPTAKLSPPTWIKPQLAALVKAAPDGLGWLHEIKLDGYRMHARLDAGRVQILTRRIRQSPKLSASYPEAANSAASFLMAARPSTSSRTRSNTGTPRLSISSSTCCSSTVKISPACPSWIARHGWKHSSSARRTRSDIAITQIGHGPSFYQVACQHGLEGIVSKRIRWSA